jgi:hypothetical protein
MPFPARSRFLREYSYHRPMPELGLVRRGERRVLERALDLEPNNRWPSCTAMMDAMKEAIENPDPEPSDGSAEVRAMTLRQ